MPISWRRSITDSVSVFTMPSTAITTASDNSAYRINSIWSIMAETSPAMSCVERTCTTMSWRTSSSRLARSWASSTVPSLFTPTMRTRPVPRAPVATAASSETTKDCKIFDGSKVPPRVASTDSPVGPATGRVSPTRQPCSCAKGAGAMMVLPSKLELPSTMSREIRSAGSPCSTSVTPKPPSW